MAESGIKDYLNNAGNVFERLYLDAITRIGLLCPLLLATFFGISFAWGGGSRPVRQKQITLTECSQTKFHNYDSHVFLRKHVKHILQTVVVSSSSAKVFFSTGSEGGTPLCICCPSNLFPKERRFSSVSSPFYSTVQSVLQPTGGLFHSLRQFVLRVLAACGPLVVCCCER
eukprot:4066262-Amphidinium_carterae.2